MKLNLEISNYKKIKDFKGEFESGNIYVIGGKNNQGKTTFLQGLAALATGVPKKVDNVSFGETKGFIKGQFDFESATKGLYTVKWDFESDKNKFVIIDQDTNVIKCTPRNNAIAEMFKYNSFTIDEWFGWGLTSEGRKKQAEIIFNLLPIELQEEYKTIEAKVSEKGGTLFSDRAEVSKKYDAAKIVLDKFKPTDEELALQAKRTDATVGLTKLETQLESQLNSEKPILELQLTQARIDSEKNMDDALDLKESIQEIEAEILRLQQNRDKYQKSLDEKTAIQKELDKVVEIVAAKIEALPKEEQTVDVLRERISKGKDFIKSIDNIDSKVLNYKNAQKEAQVYLDSYTSFDEEIKSLRERKKAIINDSELPIENITIEDGECFYKEGDNLIPFIKDSLSYSEGGIIILKLLAHLNKDLPIWLLGSAESYDNDRLAKFANIAQEYDGIIFLDRVIPDSEEGLTVNILES